jgi:glycosyltransferase involved in cell wall biosynthesis
VRARCVATPVLMRVVHVINRWGPGGAEKQLGELLRRVPLPQEVVELQGDRAGDRPRELARLGRRLAAARPDVVVAWLDRSQIAVAITVARNVPLVASIRGLPRRRGAVGAWSLRLALARYDRLVTNSVAARDATRAFARPLRLTSFEVIPNGFEIVPPRRAPAPSRRLRVGFIGRDSPDKGLDVCLDALELLGEEVEAVLIGHGVPEAVRKRRAGDRWTVFGRTERPWERSGDLDALLVPSRSEGSPNVVVEAFARGVPVIATPAGGTAELLADNRGLQIPIGDPAAVAEAVRALARHPAGAGKRAERARAYVERNHGWASVCSRWSRLLADVAAGHRRHRSRP